MARTEQDREDLLNEASALVERAEWLIPGWSEPVVAGFRPSGAMSVYFGADLVYQLDSEGRLRRAFAEGRLYRSHGTGLAQLERERTQTETVLRRTDLEGPALESFLGTARERLAGLAAVLARGELQLVAQVPQHSDLRTKVLDFLRPLISSPLELSPGIVTGRR